MVDEPYHDLEPSRPAVSRQKTATIDGLGSGSPYNVNQEFRARRTEKRSALDQETASVEALAQTSPSMSAPTSEAAPSRGLGGIVSGAISLAGKGLDAIAGLFESFVAPARDPAQSTDRGPEPQNAPSSETERDAAVHAEMQAIVQKSDASRDAAMEKQFPDHSIYNGPDRQNKGRGR